MEAKVIELYQNGVSMDKISIQTGYTKCRIIKLLKKLNLLNTKKRRQQHFSKFKSGELRNSKRVSIEIENRIIELYSELKNLNKVGQIIKMQSTSISRILKRNNIKIEANAIGEKHPMWKGGKTANKGDGYIGIWSPGHERADGGKYVYEHTLVYEKHTGKLPEKNEVLHHIDLDKHNNDITNLFLCNHKKHLSIHRQIEKLIKPLMEKGLIIFENEEYKLTI